jgi:hypothetical protein
MQLYNDVMLGTTFEPFFQYLRLTGVEVIDSRRLGKTPKYLYWID